VIREQVQSLAAAGVDLIILETFGYLDELVEAVTVTSGICDVPIVAQATFADDGHTLGGETPREVASVLSELPIAMLGTNCTIGPQRMLPIVEDLVRYSALPVSAQPNAGQPRRVGLRRFEFSLDGSYFARYLHRFAEAGASLVGGCCGTTPTHLAAAGRSLRDLPRSAGGEPRAQRRRPGRTALGHRPNGTPVNSPRGTGQAAPAPATATATATATGTLADQLAAGRFVVAAGIVPPAGGIIDEVLETVTGLQDRGISLFAVAARESARTHLDSLNMALHLQHHAGVETIATVTTWDKTIMTLQADLLGAHALGIRSIVGTTGSPPVLGDYPAVDGVWEVDSLGLAALLGGLNHGRDSNGLALSAKTSFCIGARINPGARDPDAEIARALAKVDAGAQFLVSRPVYQPGPLRDMVGALAPAGVPVLLSVTPLRSFEEAEYLAHEVPDISIPAGTLRAMERAGRGAARSTGVKLAAELLAETRPVVGGVVLTAPDEDATALLPLLDVVS
jgi:homocysteine S-methyltransferase